MTTHTPPARTRPPAPAPASAAPTRSGRWRTVNISRSERAGRILVGVTAVIAGIVLLTTAGSSAAVVLEAALIAAGLDLIVTGATGHCPLYQKLGHVPKSLRGAG